MTVTPVRLRLSPEAAPHDGYDGAWWPGSADLAAELPALLREISPELPDVSVIGYARADWAKVPATIEYENTTIVLESLVDNDASTVVAIGKSGRALSLRVIPASESVGDAGSELAEFDRPDGSGIAVGSVGVRWTAASLDDVSTRLTRIFAAGHRDDGLSAALIASWVREAGADLASAPIQAFVPVLVEHAVRERILAQRGAVSSVA